MKTVTKYPVSLVHPGFVLHFILFQNSEGYLGYLMLMEIIKKS